MGKPFNQQLVLLRHGDLSEELDDAIARVIGEVKRVGKSGELTLKLKFKLDASDRVTISDDVAMKLPKPTRETSILFLGLDGESLQKEDPRQRTLDGVKTVTDKPADVRDIRSAA